MKPHDALAITAGTATGAALANNVEQVIASAAAAIAVYLLRWAVAAVCRKLGVKPPPGE